MSEQGGGKSVPRWDAARLGSTPNRDLGVWLAAPPSLTVDAVTDDELREAGRAMVTAWSEGHLDISGPLPNRPMLLLSALCIDRILTLRRACAPEGK